MGFLGVVAGRVGCFACGECFCFGLASMAWGAECLEVVWVVCSALGEVDDVVDFGGGGCAVAAGVVVAGEGCGALIWGEAGVLAGPSVAHCLALCLWRFCFTCCVLVG